MAEPTQRRRMRAPQRHGEALVEPPLVEAGRILADNLTLADEADCDWQGRTLRQLAHQGRRELFEQARKFTTNYRDVDLTRDASDRPILLTGHQPHLFHPGVWFKNFVLSSLGQRLDAIGVNLLTENDPARTASIRVPTGSTDDPRIENVALDRAGDVIPFEERTILDRETFDSFGDRVKLAIAPLVRDPLVGQLWPLASAAAAETENLGYCVARARHQFEGRLGLTTLEIPLSTVCKTDTFRWFIAHLLAQLPRLWEIHNSSLHEYRRDNRIRSQSHPVPELATDDDWLEAPLWIWTAADLRRRRLFARCVGDQIELTDREDVRVAFSLSGDNDANRAVDQLAQLEQSGTKIRPRALLTTMYARLVLSDLFLHGIGGAKYDELTDSIIRRFYGIQPPQFLTLSATVHLPIERPDVSDEQLRQIDVLLRHLRFHPEKYLGEGIATQPSLRRLMDEKERWVETQLPRGARLERHRQITRINAELQPFVEGYRRRLIDDRNVLAKSLRRVQLLASREFSFCLFPAETLCPVLLELSSGTT